jgi:hypothetical protein
MLCSGYTLQDAAQTIAPVGNGALKIAALFEDEDGLGQAIGYYQNLKKMGIPWTQAYVSVGVGDKSFLPLQAADLLAHLSFRHLKKLVQHRGNGALPAMAPPLKRLCENHKMKIQLLKEKHITPMLAQIEQALRDGRLV